MEEIEITFQKHDGHSKRICYYYGCYDSLQYPLLFPYGEPGWHQGIKKKHTTQSQYSNGQHQVIPINPCTAEELLANEASGTYHSCTKSFFYTSKVLFSYLNCNPVYEDEDHRTNTISAREFYAYRLQIRKSDDFTILESGRLLQQFVVDMYVKIETSRLDYFRTNQTEIRADLYQEIVDSIGHGENKGSKVGKRIVLPSSFIGGSRDMRKRYLDAMTLVDKYGKPDIFLTMTCNPKWSKITNELKKHEEAQNRPDLLTRVFKSKFEELKRQVLKRKIFGPIATYTYFIEF